jgi:hypothetical protein
VGETHERATLRHRPVFWSPHVFEESYAQTTRNIVPSNVGNKENAINAVGESD